MYIISKFKDYYDVGKSVGIDKSIVYEREDKEIHHQNYEIIKEHLDKPYYFSDLFTIEREMYRSGYNLYIGYVQFCGKTYPFFKSEEKYNSNGYDDKPKIFYSVKDSANFIRSHYNDKYKKDGSLSKSVKHKLDSGIKTIKHFFENTKKIDSIDEHRLYGAPIIVLEFNLYNRSGIVIHNAQLKKLNFMSIKEPYTAFQDISMYLSGVLSNSNENTETEMSEKQKVGQHGFDKKYGFRKRPKK